MECRICLESDDPETMVQPCQCRGTSAYVHQRCLEHYFQFYPDGICRVCMFPIVYYEHRVFSRLVYALWFLALLLVISQSSTRIHIRILLSLLSGLVLYGYQRRRLESRNILGIVFLILTLYTGGQPDFNLTVAIMIFTMFYALIFYIPPIYLGTMAFIVMLTFYTTMTLHALQSFLDSYAQGITVVLAVLLWNFYIGMRPGFHLE
jgi:hypothetical protein